MKWTLLGAAVGTAIMSPAVVIPSIALDKQIKWNNRKFYFTIYKDSRIGNVLTTRTADKAIRVDIISDIDISPESYVQIGNVKHMITGKSITIENKYLTEDEILIVIIGV